MGSFPTAAVIHSIHYHQIHVQSEQEKILERENANLNDLLDIPLLPTNSLTNEEINAELEIMLKASWGM